MVGTQRTIDEQHLLEDAMRAHRNGDLEAALRHYDALLRAHPKHAAMLANRASIHLAREDAESAERDARDAVAVDPASFGAWFNLGQALRAQGDVANASSSLRRASRLRPLDARALLEWFSAAAHSQQFAGIDGRLREPMPDFATYRDLALQTAMELEQHGSATAALVVLSHLRRQAGADPEVIARYMLDFRYAKTVQLEHKRETDAALDTANRILSQAPIHRGTRMLRASVWSERGEISEAVDDLREITRRVPDDAIAGSALLIALQHDPAQTADDIADAHRQWAKRHTSNVAPPRYGDDPDRPLRIGWLSPRFFEGLVGNFFLPVLRELDRTTMTHVLYSNSAIVDATTEAFREAADGWHRVEHLDDAELCERIRADRIDILVGMSGHSPGNRLRALASRPAPLQVSSLDYFHSTGTSAIDVLISDSTLTPQRLSAMYTERIVRLPSGRLCYSPPANAPDVGDRDGTPLRFCSFNRIDKLNDSVLMCWSRILDEVPGSVLRLKARAFDGIDDCRHFIGRAARHGIGENRLELAGYGDHDEAMRAYADCDIALDPFPFSGCATSFDALWMGLPVVTKIGETMVSRQSASILHAIGLQACVAANEDEYVAIVVALAGDRSRRNVIRSSLRARMRERVCDVPRHARELGDALREAWRFSCRAR